MSADISDMDNYSQLELSKFADIRDRDTCYLFSHVRKGVPPFRDSSPCKKLPYHIAMLWDFDTFYIKDGILYRKTCSTSDEKTKHQTVMHYL